MDAGPVKCYAFPKECFGEVLNMLGIIDQKQSWFTRKPGKQIGSFMSGYGIKKYQFVLRKMLKCKKLPKKIPEHPDHPKICLVMIEKGQTVAKPYRYIENRGMNIIPIGYREDVTSVTTDEFGKEIEQEML